MRTCHSIYGSFILLALAFSTIQTQGRCADAPPEGEPNAPSPAERSEAQYKEGLALEKAGHIAEGIACWDKALKTDPQNWACMNHYAWFLAVTAPEKFPDRADAKRALTLATQAAEITKWKNHDVVDTVAECYFVLKDYKKAVATQLIALAGGTTGNAKEKYLRKQLAKFEAAAKK